LPTKDPHPRARSAWTAEDNEQVFAHPSFYAEFAPREDEACFVDSIYILKDRGRLTESRMSFASPLKELAFIFREDGPGGKVVFNEPSLDHRRKGRAFVGWIVGVKFKPNWSGSPSVHDPAIVACRDALARVVRETPSCFDILDTMDRTLLALSRQARHGSIAASASLDTPHDRVSDEQVDSLKAAIAKASARLDFVQAQLTRTSTLARQSFESQQSLDQAENDVASARAGVAEAQANYDAAVAGPTREERAIADAQVRAAAAAVTVLERRLDKMVLHAPADGVVSVIAAEVGENVRAGQPILMVEAAGRQWLSFNVREDHLNRLAMGETANVMRNGADVATKAVITELRPLGVFATWQAELVIGDHDRNTLRLRLDPKGELAGLESGMTVWIDR
jgi:HlyD family secretion protein